MTSSGWLPLDFVSDLLICKLREEWDVFHDTECPSWDQVPLQNIQLGLNIFYSWTFSLAQTLKNILCGKVTERVVLLPDKYIKVCCRLKGLTGYCFKYIDRPFASELTIYIWSEVSQRFTILTHLINLARWLTNDIEKILPRKHSYPNLIPIWPLWGHILTISCFLLPDVLARTTQGKATGRLVRTTRRLWFPQS